MGKSRHPCTDTGLFVQGDSRDILETLKNAPMGIFTSTPRGRFLSANHAMARMLGYSSPQELMHSITDIAQHLYADPKEWDSLNSLLQEKEEVFNHECRFRRRDGTFFWVSINARAVRDNGVTVAHQGFAADVTDITELKRTQEALRQSQELLKAVIDSAEDSIFIKDSMLRYVKVNAATESLLGMNARDMLGKTDRDLFGPEFGEHIEKTDKKVLTGNVMEEYPCKQVNGRERYFHTIKVPLKDKHGQITGLCGIARDITQRKLMEKQLEEEYVLRNALLDNIPNCVALILKKDTREIIASNRAGHEMSAVPGKKCFQTVALRHDPCPFCRAPELWKSGQLQEIEVEYRGSWYKGIWAPLSDDLYVHYIFDITDRKQAEESLRSMTEEQSLLLESVPVQIWYLKDPETYGSVNQAHADFFGLTREEMQHRKIWDLFTQEEARICHDGNIQVFQTGKQIHTEEWVYNARGQQRLMEIIKTPKLDPSGRVKYVICSCSDITERKRNEEMLKHLSLHDQLTGLYNRAYLENELNRLNKSREYPVGIISIDVDGLKPVNDMFGHEQGDMILKLTADILQEAFRASDIVSRSGGDEFAAILPGIDAQAGIEIVQRIRSRVEKYNREKQDAQLPLSLSVGMAVAGDDTRDLFAVFKEADDLMYRDKLNHRVTARSQIMQTILAAFKERDFITHGHAQRLEDLCRLLGEQAGLSQKQLSNLDLLARMHDLGQVGIPDHVLFKEGPLTEDEWKIMRQHPEKGYRIARSSNDLAEIADLILKHHERWDGEGYPLGLEGEEIAIECRILAIADAYDAMTSDRPYRRALDPEDAIAELKRFSGTKFDPYLMDSFIEILQQFNSK
ncbi:PAS domain S-box protein [Desulfonatronospira sp.]|uniref:PAS domain S-box protein n=1 Tax=Desulfonatronospira sp. TaxID=1962951 RepID=UPI0025BF84B0|nr:PAS domain S-box protein [Desulfonatronospira sp.]